MGEDEACRRVAGARLVRRFPTVLGMIECGELHLTALLLLGAHLTDDNHQELLRAASGKTKNAVLHLLAERFPRPDATARIQPLPNGPLHGPASGGAEARPATSAAPATPNLSRVEPLSAERYKVQFTASAEVKDKIERAANLMRHANPSGDLSVVMDRALDLLIAQLEKRRLGKTTRASNGAPTQNSRRGYVPRAVRREVFERDGEQCTYVDDLGRRCPSRSFLELDHRTPRALGGTDDASNLSVKCRAHNLLAAERDFGRAHIEQHKQTKNSREDVHPRQRGYGDDSRGGGDDHVAFRALCGMGFKDREARRALAVLEQRRATSPPPPLETLLRDALSVLA
jgi:hypothetical protein